MAAPLTVPADVVATFGRSVVIDADDPVPELWAHAPVVDVDERAVAGDPSTVDRLHRLWVSRTPFVARLHVPPASLRAPEVCSDPFTFGAAGTFLRERTSWLCWVNSYDGRGWTVQGLRWWWTARALRAGATPFDGDPGDGDVVVDGHVVHLDGGPRGQLDRPSCHVESVQSGRAHLDGTGWPSTALDDRQLAAVTHGGGAARILAPAGSGKTRVLTERVRFLLGIRRWEPASILVLAYNTRAVDELRDRLGGAGKGVQVKTLHAFAYQILRSANLGGDVADDREKLSALHRLWRDPQGGNRHRDVLEVFALTRSLLVRPSEVPTASALPVTGGTLDALFDRWRADLASRGKVDFDDMVFAALAALCADPDLRRRVQARCRHVLVDEAQDLTPAQLALIRVVSSPALDVFSVGDDDQTIYQHNGADSAWLVDFDSWFPGAAAVTLSTNYRCPGPVVAGAARLLACNTRRVDKDLRAANAGEEPVWIPADGRGVDEVAGTVVAALADSYQPGDVAVLTRTNAALLPYVVALRSAGVPVRSSLSAEHVASGPVKAAQAWLRAAKMPAVPGDVVVTCARNPQVGISRKLLDTVAARSWDLADLERLARTAGLTGRAGDTWADFVGCVRTLQSNARAGASDAELLDVVRDRWGTREGSGPFAAVAAVAGLVDGDLSRVVASAVRDDDGPCVALSAVHRVKGREWPVVVVAAADASEFPHGRSADVEEERRLFHVAVTRAARQLTIVGDRRSPSPFVAEFFTGGRRDRQLTGPPSPAPSKPPADRREPWTPTVGATVALAGGHRGPVVTVDDDGIVVDVGGRLRARFGDTVTVHGRRHRLERPASQEPVDPDEFARAVLAAAGRCGNERVARRVADRRPGSPVALIDTVGAGWAARLLDDTGLDR